MTENSPTTYSSQEEAQDALHKYAWNYAETSGDAHDYEVFTAAHTALEVQEGTWAIALKPGHSPVSFTSSTLN